MQTDQHIPLLNPIRVRRAGRADIGHQQSASVRLIRQQVGPVRNAGQLQPQHVPRLLCAGSGDDGGSRHRQRHSCGRSLRGDRQWWQSGLGGGVLLAIASGIQHQREKFRLVFAFPAVGQIELVPDDPAQQRPLQVRGIDDFRVPHLFDHIARFHPGGFRRRVRSDRAHDQLAIRTPFVIERRHAVEHIRVLLAHQLGDLDPGIVDRNREPDPLRAGADGHVDRDHVPVRVDQRATAVTGIDGGIGLNQILVGLLFVEFDIAPDRAHDPFGHGVFPAEGVADCDHILTDHQVGRGAQRHHRQTGGRIDLDDRQVSHLVRVEHAGLVGRPVGERHLNRLHAINHMMIGDNIAPLINDDSGAHAVDLGPTGIKQHGRGTGLLFRMDIDGRFHDAIECRRLSRSPKRRLRSDGIVGRDVGAHGEGDTQSKANQELCHADLSWTGLSGSRQSWQNPSAMWGASPLTPLRCDRSGSSRGMKPPRGPRIPCLIGTCGTGEAVPAAHDEFEDLRC